MIQLTKEQAMEISELHFEYLEKHPNATREELLDAFYKIKRKVLKESKNKN